MNEIHLEQSYLSLPETLYSKMEPYSNTKSEIVLLNKDLIHQLRLNYDFLNQTEGVAFLSGNTDLYGSLFSQAYAGHQYGHFTILGDGRAVLLGEIMVENQRYDIQLKGTGRTPYSRRGDGKATVYAMLREYLISEAMHHLKIPTTRSLAVLNTNENIIRMTEEQGGILCRVAQSHIRVGTFEFAKAKTDRKTLQALADYTIERHFKEISQESNKYQLLLREVIQRQARLIAKWQSIGFVHGVINTDNVLISGETIDYGPCAFLDNYDPSISFSSIDNQGRYSYQNQPFIASWNLSKFAESILDLLDDDIQIAISIANQELIRFQEYYEKSYYEVFSKKLGFHDITKEEYVIVDELLLIMRKYQADFTNTFYYLTTDQYQKLSFYNTEDFTLWFQKWTRQLGYRRIEPKERIQLMEQHNPVLIPRNNVVEEALHKASKSNDYTLLHILLEKLKHPYNYMIQHDSFFQHPIHKEQPYVTYCGT